MYVENKASKVFELAPEGDYQAVLIDVVDLGLITSTFNGETKTQHKIMLVWQATEQDPQGNPYRFFKRYTVSLHAKSNLTAAIKKMTKQVPQKGFELDDLIGVNSNLEIAHQTNTSTGKTYTIVESIRYSKSRDLKVPADYVRQPAKGTAAVVTTALAAQPRVEMTEETDEREPAYAATDSELSF
jgi:hypothetical protein